MLFYPQHVSILPPRNVSISIVFGVHCSRIVLVYSVDPSSGALLQSVSTDTENNT